MKRYTLRHITQYILTFALILISALSIYAQPKEIEHYSELTKLSSDELITVGNDCFIRCSTDSAMVCYSIIINRMETKTHDDKFRLIRAYNNRGCVALCYLDYQRAYDCFTRAIELSDEYKINTIRLTAQYNLIKLLSSHNNSRFSSRPVSVELHSQYEELMNSAMNNDWSVYVSAFIDLTEFDSNIDLSKYNIILTNKIPADTYDLEHARICYHAIECQQQGRYAEARTWYSKLLDGNAETHIAYERFILLAHLGTAHNYALENRYDEAIAELEKTESMALSGQAIEYVVVIYQKLAEYYQALGEENMSQHYKIRQLEKIDSLNQSNNLMNILVNDIQQKEMLNNKLLEEQRHQRNILMGILIALTIISIFAIVLLRAYRIVKVRNKSLYEKNHAVMQAEAQERQLRKQYEQMLQKQREEEASTNKEQQDDTQATTPQKYSKSNLNNEEKQRLIGLILDVLNNPENICQHDFTLSRLSKLVESNNTYVSQVINEKYNTSFSNLLNIYRVKEACRRLDDIEQYGNQTIEAIYQSVGFKTRITFAKAFKSEVGLTPSEYLQMAKARHNQ